MKIAILSRGPSLRYTMPVDDWNFQKSNRVELQSGRNKYDHSIGVLNVADEYLCDWVCCRDWDAFCNMSPIGRPSWAVNINIGQNIVDFHGPGVWDMRESSPALKHINPQTGIRRWREQMHEARALHFHEAMLFPMSQIGTRLWYSYSGTAALGTAFWLIHQNQPFEWCPPHQIDCYGVDLTGTTDHAGNPNETRSPERWEDEGCIWGGMVEMIQRYGVTVRRIHPPRPDVLPA